MVGFVPKVSELERLGAGEGMEGVAETGSEGEGKGGNEESRFYKEGR